MGRMSFYLMRLHRFLKGYSLAWEVGSVTCSEVPIIMIFLIGTSEHYRIWPMNNVIQATIKYLLVFVSGISIRYGFELVIWRENSSHIPNKFLSNQVTPRAMLLIYFRF